MATKEIFSSATYQTAEYNTSNSVYSFYGSLDVGNVFSYRIGRGFMSFDLSSYGKEINAITGAKLVLNYGANFGLPISLKVSKFSKLDLGSNAQTAFLDLGNSSYNTVITTLSLTTSNIANGSEVTININDIKNAYNNNNPKKFNLSFVLTANEDSSGVAVNATSKLIITYDDTAPNPPTNVQAIATTPAGATSSQAVLSWNHATSGGIRTGYRIYNGATLLKTEPSTAIGTTITGLNPSTPYTLCVIAYNDFNQSACANVSFTTPAIPPTISGPSSIYYSGTAFTLNNPPSGTITWGMSSGAPFTISPTTGATTYVTKTANSGTGVLTAYVGGVSVATLLITAHLVVPDGADNFSGGQTNSYLLPVVSGATYYWDDGQHITVTSGRTSAAANYTAPYGVTSHDYVGCTVTLNGVSNYVSKMVNIYP